MTEKGRQIRELRPQNTTPTQRQSLIYLPSTEVNNSVQHATICR